MALALPHTGGRRFDTQTFGFRDGSTGARQPHRGARRSRWHSHPPLPPSPMGAGGQAMTDTRTYRTRADEPQPRLRLRLRLRAGPAVITLK